ncbi:hypothetical protein BKA93DRAFT_916343 [Sparassis latifolia]
MLSLLSSARLPTVHSLVRNPSSVRWASNAPKRFKRWLALEFASYPLRIRKLLLKLYPYVESGQHGIALQQFQLTVSKGAFDNPSRFLAYEGAVSLFLRHGHVIPAAMMYSRMITDGFIPSVSLRTQMFIIAAAQESPSEDELLDALGKLFSHKSFNERTLRHVLHLLVGTMNCTPEFIDSVVATFVRTRTDLGYILAKETRSFLVHIHARAGSAASARRWASGDFVGQPEKVADSLQAESDIGRPKKDSPAPYTSLIRHLAPAEVTGATSKWTVAHMADDAVEPDLAFCNAIIATEVSQHYVDQAFQIYQVLLDDDTGEFLPDAYTFSSLFRAMCIKKQRRSVRTRRSPPSVAVRTPRALYREMLQCHARQAQSVVPRRSPVITSDVLHRALRTFLLAQDYAAVFVVLRTFRMCKLLPTLRTFRIVLAHLVHRVRSELPAAARMEYPEELWAFRFLGYPPVGVIQGLPVTETVLQVGAVPRLSLKFIPPASEDSTQAREEKLIRSISPSSQDSTQAADRKLTSSSALPARPQSITSSSGTPDQQHVVPSVLDIVGETAPPQAIWDATPLERILRRAILAQTRYTMTTTPARIVSGAIADAKAAMLPNEWTKRRERRKPG